MAEVASKFYSAYNPFGGGWFVMQTVRGSDKHIAGPFETKADADAVAECRNQGHTP